MLVTMGACIHTLFETLHHTPYICSQRVNWVRCYIVIMGTCIHTLFETLHHIPYMQPRESIEWDGLSNINGHVAQLHCKYHRKHTLLYIITTHVGIPAWGETSAAHTSCPSRRLQETCWCSGCCLHLAHGNDQKSLWLSPQLCCPSCSVCRETLAWTWIPHLCVCVCVCVCVHIYIMQIGKYLCCVHAHVCMLGCGCVGVWVVQSHSSQDIQSPNHTIGCTTSKDPQEIVATTPNDCKGKQEWARTKAGNRSPHWHLTTGFLHKVHTLCTPIVYTTQKTLHFAL